MVKEKFNLDTRFQELLQWVVNKENLPFLLQSLETIKELVDFCNLDTPYLYLNDEDCLLLEWDFKDWFISIDFEKNGVFGDATNCRKYDSEDFELPSPFTQETLNEKVKILLEKTGWWERDI